MNKENTNYIELESQFYSIMSQTAAKLGVSEDTFAKMAIGHFLCSPIITSLSEQETTEIAENEKYEVKNSDYLEVPEIYYDNTLSYLSIDHISFDKINTLVDEHLDTKTILWGQFNRFLPIKVSLRILADLCQRKEEGEYVTLDEWFVYVTETCLDIRQYLEIADSKMNNPRGEILASGFPRKGENQEKSLNRYINHFCAELYKEKEVTGFPVQLGLICVLPIDENSEGDFHEWGVCLTKLGLDYVKMMNPVIDQQDKTISMSKAEQYFMIERIRMGLPATWGFFQFILSSIMEGVNTPTLISNAIESTYGKNTSRNWNKKQISTYRTGAIGLLGDLGLVSRNWNYRSVTYFLTDDGKSWVPKN